jgi:prevent-host-death family protein
LGRGSGRRSLSDGVSTVLAVAARPEDLTEEQLALQRADQRSWDVAPEFLAATEPIVAGAGADRARSSYHDVMKVATSTEVGIRDLKNGLSKYLERVRAGEEVIVTDRGRPVARLSAIDESTDRLADLVAAGVVRAPTRKTRRRPSRRIDAKGSVSDLVAEQRR